jgi:hypothetical protein
LLLELSSSRIDSIEEEDDNFTFQCFVVALKIGYRPPNQMSFWVTTRTHYCGFLWPAAAASYRGLDLTSSLVMETVGANRGAKNHHFDNYSNFIVLFLYFVIKNKHFVKMWFVSYSTL